ncbi:MAG TPA: pyridoxal-dependent decarboxylase, partial [Candidatus Binatia bacterium]|nr:pyridoxal-dependent decarboxylase [Candidatus Binatia bacterium]
MEFPRQPKSRSEVLALLARAGEHDVRFREGRLFSLVYGVDDEHAGLLADATAMYLATNGLGRGFLFQSLGRFEEELVGGALALLGAPDGAGSVTSGGTESIIMGLRAAREARRAAGTLPAEPEVVVPLTAHPAFEKACALMDMRLVRTAVRDDTRADPDAFRAAFTERTIAAAGSAPSYPFGTVDDVPALAAIAAAADVHFHTDACVGGFALPWLERAGQGGIPAWDFRVPGVRTVSADLHKYGFAARGISLVLYRDAALARHARFRLGTWNGGPYVTPTLAGSRPGGVVAAAWAAVQYFGQEGYTRLHSELRRTAERYMRGVEAAGFRVLGDPPMHLFAFAPARPGVDANAVADDMLARGWVVARQPTDPPSLHLLLTPPHAAVCDAFCR